MHVSTLEVVIEGPDRQSFPVAFLPLCDLKSPTRFDQAEPSEYGV